MSIKLSGTDVSKNRELQELNKWTIFGKKPLDTWWVEDKLSGETEEIDLGDAAKVLKKDTNP
jgi:hypothetical protein